MHRLLFRLRHGQGAAQPQAEGLRGPDGEAGVRLSHMQGNEEKHKGLCFRRRSQVQDSFFKSDTAIKLLDICAPFQEALPRRPPQRPLRPVLLLPGLRPRLRLRHRPEVARRHPHGRGRLHLPGLQKVIQPEGQAQEVRVSCTGELASRWLKDFLSSLPRKAFGDPLRSALSLPLRQVSGMRSHVHQEGQGQGTRCSSWRVGAERTCLF